MIRRLLAAGLAFSIGAGPAAAQVVESVPASVVVIEGAPIETLSESASAPSTLEVLSAPLESSSLSSAPGLSQAGRAELRRGQRESAPRAMPGLSAAASAPSSAGKVFDRSGRKPDETASADDGAPVPPPSRSGKRTAIALGAAAGVAAPIAWAAAPPLSAVHTGLAAFASVVAVTALAAVGRAAWARYRGDPGPLKALPRSTAARSFLFGAAAAGGLLLGAAFVGPVTSPLTHYAAGAGLAAAGAFAGASILTKVVRSGPIVRPSIVAAAGATLGLALGAAPALSVNPVFYALTAELGLVAVLGVVKAAVGIARGASSLVRSAMRGTAPPKATFATFAVGFGLGLAPSAYDGRLILSESRFAEDAGDTLTHVPSAPDRVPSSWKPILPFVAKKRDFRELPPAFRDELVKTLQQNPEGRKLLESFKDRAGTIRLPRFFVGKLDDGASGFYFPVFNATFLDSDRDLDGVWTDPEKARALARKVDELEFHELVHGKQFRKSFFFPGQFDHFPNQLTSYLHIEMEKEAHFDSMVYIHEKLKADPHADLEGNSFSYGIFITDLEDFWADLDDSGPYEQFIHIDNAYYRKRLGELRARWPAISAEGYELMSQRAMPEKPDDAKEYHERAVRRAQEYGLPAPEGRR